MIVMTAKVPTAMAVRVVACAVLAAATTISLMVVCAIVYAYMDEKHTDKGEAMKAMR